MQSNTRKLPGISPRVAVFGEWNTTNLGDRAIFEEVITFFEEIGWVVDGYGLGSLTSITSSETPVNSSTKATDRNVVGKRDFTRTNPRHRIPGLPSHLKRFIRGIRQYFRIRQLLPQLQQVQAIVVGGGALLSDWNMHFPQSLAMLTWAARHLQLPIFCLGCSAEGEWSPKGEKNISDFAQLCQYIATRDQGTADRIAELVSAPVEVFGDFALRELQSRKKIKSSEETIIAINVMELPAIFERYQQLYETMLVDALHIWYQQDHGDFRPHIKLFTTGTPEDIVPAERVFSRLLFEEKSLSIPLDLKSLKSTLQSSEIVVAARLHAAILAISEETPVIGFSVGSKIKRFLQTLNIHEFSLDATEQGGAQALAEALSHDKLKQQVEAICWTNIKAIRNKTKAHFYEICSFERT